MSDGFLNGRSNNWRSLNDDSSAVRAYNGGRSWFLVKFGTKTICLRNRDVIAEFIGVMCRFLNDNHLDVPQRTVVSPVIVSQEDALFRGIEESLSACSSTHLPILIYIEDCESGQLFAQLQHQFGRLCCMFLVNGFELEEMYTNCCYDPLRDWCVEFADVVRKHDHTVQELSMNRIMTKDDSSTTSSSSHGLTALGRLRLDDDPRGSDLTESEFVSCDDGARGVVDNADEYISSLASEGCDDMLELVDSESSDTDSDRNVDIRRNTISRTADYAGAGTSTNYHPVRTLRTNGGQVSNEERDDDWPSVRPPPGLGSQYDHPRDPSPSYRREHEPPGLARKPPSPEYESDPPTPPYTPPDHREHPPLAATVSEQEVKDALREMMQHNLEQSDMPSLIVCEALSRRLDEPFELLDGNVLLTNLITLCGRVTRGDQQTFIDRLLSEAAVHSRFLHTTVMQLGRVVSDWAPESDWMPADISHAVMIVLQFFEVLSRLRMICEPAMIAFNIFEDVLKVLPREVKDVIDADLFDDVLFVVRHGREREVPQRLDNLPDVPAGHAHKDFRVDAGGQAGTLKEEVVEPIWAHSENVAPPCDFRQLPVTVVKSDLHRPARPYIRRSVVPGAYTDSEHYFDVVFRLFREDLVSPLRDGLCLWKQGAAEFRASDLFIMDNVKVGCAQVKDGDVKRILSYPRNLIMPSDSRLRFGSMIAISSDKFQNQYFLGIVVDSNVMQGTVEVRFLDEDCTQNNKAKSEIDGSKPYMLVESPAFLEAYTHVLSAIREINPFRSFPFERYLVHGKTDVWKPVYMRPTSIVAFNENKIVQKEYDEKADKWKKKLGPGTEMDTFKQMYQDDDKETADYRSLYRSCLASRHEHTFRPRQPDQKKLDTITLRGTEYPVATLVQDYKPTDIIMDQSQKIALCRALTQELTLVQGPPGTGKTFLGVEIVMRMLENRQRWLITEPILVVCYTNQALDQFLERLHRKIQEEQSVGRLRNNNSGRHSYSTVVRLGSRSESQYIADNHILLKEVLADYELSLEHEGKRRTGPAIGPLMGEIRDYDKLISRSLAVVRGHKLVVLSASIIFPVIKFSQRQSFEKKANNALDTNNNPLCDDEVLALWLADVSVDSLRGSDMQPYSLNNGPDILLAPSPDEEQADEQEMAELLKKLNECALDRESRISEDADELQMFDAINDWDVDIRGKEVRKVIIFGEKQKIVRRRKAVVDLCIVQRFEQIQDSIMKVSPLTDEEANSIVDVYELPRARRWQLYLYWCRKAASAHRSSLPNLIKSQKKAFKDFMSTRDERDAIALSKTLIIGATTTGAARRRNLLQRLNCRSLIVEEAAEVLEAHILASLLPSLEHAIFIGDHQQLKPNPAVFALAREYNLDVSMFERLIRNGFPFITLEVQHRMLPLLTSTVVRPTFYNCLQDADRVFEYPDVQGMVKNVFFWAHDYPEDAMGGDEMSKRNSYEVEQAVALVRYILQQKQYSLDQVTVLCTYSAQTSAMRNAMSMVFGTHEETEEPLVEVVTVDGYQGRENRVIILSVVRSLRDSIGFLAVKNRICVAWTRAQHGLYILGNANFLAKNRLWNEMLASLEREELVGYGLPVKCSVHQTVMEINSPEEFDVYCPDGGCRKLCETKLPNCSHQCPKRCHPDPDTFHSTYTCTQKCNKPCARNVHTCVKVCSAECGKCMQMVEVDLECGHRTTTTCSHEGKPPCHHRCTKKLSCGHPCAEMCSVPCSNECFELVPYTYDSCGHTVQVECRRLEEYKSPFKPALCEAPCGMDLFCGHTCKMPCSVDCPHVCKEPVSKTLTKCKHTITVPCCDKDDPYLKCTADVETVVEGCGHTSLVPCSAGSSREFCRAVCRAPLECGTSSRQHVCTRKCGECFAVGKHVCTDTCTRLKKCGHPCVQKCGVPCDESECRSSCMTECSHAKCGGVNNTQSGRLMLDRRCTEPCFLCTNHCDNQCEHRGCSKRCFEVCNVPPCQARCTKLLKCRHSCLGLCQEPCPSVCATCDIDGYRKVVSVLGEREKLYTLMLLPACRHVFPTKYLDAHVQKCVDKDEVLHCPDCKAPIISSKRYARIIKERILAKEKKLVASFPDAYRWDLLEKTRINMNSIQESVSKRPRKMTVKLTKVKDFELIRMRLNELSSELFTKATENGLDDIVFWDHYASVLLALCYVHEELQKEGRMGFRAQATHKSMKQLFERSLGKAVNEQLECQLTQMIDLLATSLPTKLSGTFMPQALSNLYSMIFQIQMFRVGKFLASGNGTKALDVPQRALVPLQVAVSNCTPKELRSGKNYKNWKRNFEQFDRMMRESYFAHCSQLSTFNWDLPFDIPDF